MKIINAIAWVAAVGVAASLAIVMPAFAQTSISAGVTMQGGVHDGANGGVWRSGTMPGVFGTVTAVDTSAGTLTVTATAHSSRPMPEQKTTVTPSATTTVYTVNASNAQIYKGSATTTVSLSSVAAGDTVMVQGTVTGTTVVATVIRDGMNGVMGTAGKRDFGKGVASGTPPTSPIQGNGQPVIGGAVASVSGTTLTVTNASNVTYTIDASGAKIVKNGTTTTRRFRLRSAA